MNAEAKQAIPKRKSYKRRNKKLLLLFIVFGFTAFMLVGITYAWFVGTGNVKVNSFAVNLRSENSLEISLDGYTWDEEINVNENNIRAHSISGLAYENNTNSWVGENGLVPVSSSGDNINGRLTLFSKTSLTSSEGGYRLVAGAVDNSINEKNHYVTFDIFIKNKSGDVYNPDYNLLDDENIYLTSDSVVLGTASGNTSYGVQNTARVAFVQVGRISIDDLVNNETPDIKCSTPLAGDKYTPLCDAEGNHYRTMIWEPNDTAHDSKLVSYYNTICHKRSLDGTYTDQSCTDITEGYVPTYTIKQNITSADEVDIYDGLNYYTSDISLPTKSAKSLQNTKTFTDTMKATGGEYTFMKLAPHSVTKIRVYVYLEGQDVDNYDLITNDLNISVNFGFTKDRTYTGTIADDSYFMKLSLAEDPIEPNSDPGNEPGTDPIEDPIDNPTETPITLAQYVMDLSSTNSNVVVDTERNGKQNYRYIGSSAKNYVCLGATDASCTGGLKYRIIGVFGDDVHGQSGDKLVKLVSANAISNIKYDAKGQNVGSRGNSNYPSSDWSDAQLMYMLNGTNYINSGYKNGSSTPIHNWTNSSGNIMANGVKIFTVNGSYYDGGGTINIPNTANSSSGYTAQTKSVTGLNSTARNLIQEVKWHTGLVDYNDYYSTQVIYEKENGPNTLPNRPDYWIGKVGLMSLSDILYATSGGSRNRDRAYCLSQGDYDEGYNYPYSSCDENNWITENDNFYSITPADGIYEDEGKESVWGYEYEEAYWEYYYYVAGLRFNQSSYRYNVYPTVYLKEDVLYKSGTGTSKDPYIIGLS